MVMSEKRLVGVNLHSNFQYELEGPIEDSIKILEKIRDDNAGKYDVIRLSVDSQYEGGCYITIVAERIETDEEFEVRSRKDREWEARNKENARLQAIKYGFLPPDSTN